MVSKVQCRIGFFLLLLVPSIVMSVFVLNFDTVIRKTVAFNISGPVCLGLASFTLLDVNGTRTKSIRLY
jgi:hypothetical protein